MTEKLISLKIFSNELEIDDARFIILRLVSYLPMPFAYGRRGLEIRKFDENAFVYEDDWNVYSRNTLSLGFFAFSGLAILFLFFQHSILICSLLASAFALSATLFRTMHAYGKILCGYKNIPPTEKIRIYLVPTKQTFFLSLLFSLVGLTLAVVNYFLIVSCGGNFMTVVVVPLLWGFFLVDIFFSTPMTFSQKYKISKITHDGKEISLEEAKELLPAGEISPKKVLTEKERNKKRKDIFIGTLIMIASIILIVWGLIG